MKTLPNISQMPTAMLSTVHVLEILSMNKIAPPTSKITVLFQLMGEAKKKQNR